MMESNKKSFDIVKQNIFLRPKKIEYLFEN